MILYAIRHKKTGQLMPNHFKGHTHWVPDSLPNGIPRLFISAKTAKYSIIQWARGKQAPEPLYDPFGEYIGVSVVVTPCGRSKDDLEVVKFSLRESK